MKQIFVIVMALLALSAAVAAQGTAALGEAKRFESRAVGEGGTTSETWLAFKRELEKGAEARPVFERWLRQGSPAARLYSAIGLYKLQPLRGTEALRELLRDTSAVITVDGCEVEETTVDQVAKRLLDRPEDIRGYVD